MPQKRTAPPSAQQPKKKKTLRRVPVERMTENEAARELLELANDNLRALRQEADNIKKRLRKHHCIRTIFPNLAKADDANHERTKEEVRKVMEELDELLGLE